MGYGALAVAALVWWAVSGSRGDSTRPVVMVPVASVLSSIGKSIATQRESSGVPLFAGMPPASTWPTGYAPVRVWAQRPGSGGWEPRPDRFVQWAPVLEEMRTRMPYATYAKRWADRHWFGVVTPDNQLDFYVFGRKRINNASCCSEASHVTSRVDAGGGTVRVLRRGVSGPVPSPWTCDQRPAECFDVVPRPIIAHPLAQTEPEFPPKRPRPEGLRR